MEAPRLEDSPPVEPPTREERMFTERQQLWMIMFNLQAAAATLAKDKDPAGAAEHIADETLLRMDELEERLAKKKEKDK